MKLTSIKMSIPVLMLMISQSGYGVSDWFGRACIAMVRGDISTATRLIIENNPGSVTMTNQAKESLVAETKDSIKNDIDNFIPRGIKDAEKEAFQEEVIKAMIALADITDKSLQDSFKNTIVSNFYKNIGWLGRSEAVYKEVTEVTTVFANSYVPGTESNIPAALLGRIGEFVEKYSKGDAAGSKTELTDLLSYANLTALGADKLDRTYYTIKGEVDKVEGTRPATDQQAARTEREVKSDQKKAVYRALASQANKIRDLCLSENKGVNWNRADLNASSENIAGSTASDRAESLRKALYSGAAGSINQNIQLYLNLFGYWKIDQNEFLQKILDKVNVPGNVEDAVYSTFGEEYENLLRHSVDDGNTARQKKLVNAVSGITSESTDDQKAEAVAGSIETLDNATASKIRSSVDVLKKVN